MKTEKFSNFDNYLDKNASENNAKKTKLPNLLTVKKKSKFLFDVVMEDAKNFVPINLIEKEYWENFDQDSTETESLSSNSEASFALELTHLNNFENVQNTSFDEDINIPRRKKACKNLDQVIIKLKESGRSW